MQIYLTRNLKYEILTPTPSKKGRAPYSRTECDDFKQALWDRLG